MHYDCHVIIICCTNIAIFVFYYIFFCPFIRVFISLFFGLQGASKFEDPGDNVSYYELLKLKNMDFTATQLKAAYRAAARKNHPDRVKDPELKKVAQKVFMRVSTAYDTIGDEQKRREYDELLTMGIYDYDPETYRRAKEEGTGAGYFHDPTYVLCICVSCTCACMCVGVPGAGGGGGAVRILCTCVVLSLLPVCLRLWIVCFFFSFRNLTCIACFFVVIY
jgi:DnaJ domain